MVEKIKTKRLTNFKWLNLFNSTRILSNGFLLNWIFASRKKKQTKKEKRKPDAVIIIPVLNISDVSYYAEDYRLLMIKEYRLPIQDYEYGFPAGLIEENDTPEETAKRELREETGYKIKKITHISPPTYSSAGMTDESVVYVFCEVKNQPEKQKVEKSEEIEILLLSEKELINFEKLGHFGSKAYAIAHMARVAGIHNLLQEGIK